MASRLVLAAADLSRPWTGSVACGRKSAKATINAAMAACEKARKAQGITDARCYPYADGQLK